MNKKIVFLISGSGGVGKDTLINNISNTFHNEIIIKNYSSIDYIKEISKKYLGWNGVKDNKGRKLLSDIKKACVEYNNLPLTLCEKEYFNFMKDDSIKKGVLFIHIREFEEIIKFKKDKFNVYSMIIDTNRDSIKKSFGNDSDDLSYKFKDLYDYCIYNDDIKIATIEIKEIINNLL